MTTRKKESEASNQKTFLDKLNYYFEPRLNTWFWISFALLALFSFLFFDPKVSIGGDDSEYINRGYNFIFKGNFPSFQGPLYPIFLGIIIWIAGLKLVILKIFSVLFMLVHFWLFFQILKRYLPAGILVPVLVILAINASMLYYASSTYTESFFLMIQSFFLFVVEKHFIREPQESYSFKKDFQKFLLLGLAIFLMSLTKNIGLTALIAVILFFLIKKKWLAVAFTILAFAIFQVPLTVIKSTAFEKEGAQISSQGSSLLLKVHNNKAAGYEDFSGYIDRVVINSKEYLSKHFGVIFGLKGGERPESSGFWTLVIYAVLITGFITLFSKSTFWNFTGIYLIVSCGMTFLALQTYWSQERLILVYTPLILIYLLFTIYFIIQNYKPGFSWVFVVVLGIFFITNAYRTISQIPEKTEALSHYLKGDMLYGFTPDWINYFAMSKWIAENLPEDAYVGARKPGMAFIYSGGKDFYGIWKVPQGSPEDLYQILKDKGVTHVMMASLRVDPNRKTDRTISTVRRYLQIIHSAYPDKLEFVHKIGESEPVFLYKLK